MNIMNAFALAIIEPTHFAFPRTQDIFMPGFTYALLQVIGTRAISNASLFNHEHPFLSTGI